MRGTVTFMIKYSQLWSISDSLFLICAPSDPFIVKNPLHFIFLSMLHPVFFFFTFMLFMFAVNVCTAALLSGSRLTAQWALQSSESIRSFPSHLKLMYYKDQHYVCWVTPRRADDGGPVSCSFGFTIMCTCTRNEILSFSLLTWLMKEGRHWELSTLKIS